MSEEEETKVVEQPLEETKITVTPPKKEKDPKRVAQGKRLAAISKQAKERKLREKIEQESRMDFSVNYNSLLYFGIPSIVFAGFYLYFSAKNKNQAAAVKVHYSPAKKEEEPQTKNAARVLKKVSLFD